MPRAARYKCSNCGKRGHNTRACPEPKRRRRGAAAAGKPSDAPPAAPRTSVDVALAGGVEEVLPNPVAPREAGSGPGPVGLPVGPAAQSEAAAAAVPAADGGQRAEAPAATPAAPASVAPRPGELHLDPRLLERAAPAARIVVYRLGNFARAKMARLPPVSPYDDRGRVTAEADEIGKLTAEVALEAVDRYASGKVDPFYVKCGALVAALSTVFLGIDPNDMGAHFGLEDAPPPAPAPTLRVVQDPQGGGAAPSG